MKEFHVSANEAGQRFDKLLGKYLNLAPKSFIYKMLRKKNITLNGKKASGSEITQIEDMVKIFLSDETFEKFSTVKLGQEPEASSFESQMKWGRIKPLEPEMILYEDEHIMILNKPVGILSQKAEESDISMNERMISYLLHTGAVDEIQLQTFRPSVCNRLDRNTSGILLAGKSLTGLQFLSRLLKERTVHKYYTCLVKGDVTDAQRIEGYLKKDEEKNQVMVYDAPVEDAKKIVTQYQPLQTGQKATYMEIWLITGRSHQIRAHLSGIGHPILGDMKYGDRSLNEELRKKFGLKSQLLHSSRIEFPEIEGTFSYLSSRVFSAPEPKMFSVVKSEVL
ncbi:MAG: RluA family pseudouridine synthase [Muricoprocola sp.]